MERGNVMNIRRIRALIAILFFIVCAILLHGTAFAADIITTPEGIVFDKDTGRITDYTGSGGAVTIPKTIDGVAVVRIGNRALKDCTNITSIDIQADITHIEDGAFEACTNMTSINIPTSVTYIGGFVFKHTDITSISIPEGITKIENETFYECLSLVSVSLPETITSIGDHAFGSCDNLESINIPYGVTIIEAYAFAGCRDEEFKHVVIPATVHTIQYNAFLACFSLESVRIPDSVIDIGSDVFSSSEHRITIYGHKNSRAESYASEYGINFFPMYKVIFNGNGSTDTMRTQSIIYDKTEALYTNTLTRAGYTYSHWTTQSDGGGTIYADGGDYLMDTQGITLYAQWTPIPVTGIEFDNDTETWSLGTAATPGYTITPDDALVQSVTWHSDNPAVASVDVNGIVTANSVGIARITITSDDTTNGVISDTITLQVVDMTPENPDTHKGNIVGTLLDSSGNPLAGYNITLYTNPINMVTDADGGFAFMGMPFDHHTLVVSDSSNKEIGRYTLNFTQGSHNTYTVDIDNSVVDITFRKSTNGLDITIQANEDLNDISIAQLLYSLDPVPEIVKNPETGQDFTRNINMLGVAIILLLSVSLLVKIVVAKSQNKAR